MSHRASISHERAFRASVFGVSPKTPSLPLPDLPVTAAIFRAALAQNNIQPSTISYLQVNRRGIDSLFLIVSVRITNWPPFTTRPRDCESTSKNGSSNPLESHCRG